MDEHARRQGGNVLLRPEPPGGRLRRWPGANALLLLLVCAVFLFPAPVQAEDLHDRSLDVPVSLSLTGWGWCLSYKDVANVTLDLDGTLLTRSGDEEVNDLYLTGTLQFNLPDRTDNFALELRGTKVRSLFFLKQVGGGDQPLIAEFEGTWLDETNYVAGEGVLAVPRPDFLAVPYFLVVRTTDTDVPERAPGGGWVEDWEFIIQKGTLAFDGVADEFTRGGEAIKEQLGGFLTRVAAIVREMRQLGTPYFL
jgi:hypothetical protein